MRCLVVKFGHYNIILDIFYYFCINQNSYEKYILFSFNIIVLLRVP